jgi:hypothetical protein
MLGVLGVGNATWMMRERFLEDDSITMEMYGGRTMNATSLLESLRRYQQVK